MAAKGRYNSAKMEEQQRDHALYIALAPAADPQIALAVIVENAGWGAGSAAPIARRVFDYMLLGQYPSEEDMAAVQKGQAGAPIGKPRLAADMAGLLVAGGSGVAPAAKALAPPVVHGRTPLKPSKELKSAKKSKKAKTADVAAPASRPAPSAAAGDVNAD